MAIELTEPGNFIRTIRKAPASEVRFSYDKAADVLYVSFGDVKEASDTELFDNDVIARYDDKNHIIGLTILHASADMESRFSEALRLTNA